VESLPCGEIEAGLQLWAFAECCILGGTRHGRVSPFRNRRAIAPLQTAFPVARLRVCRRGNCSAVAKHDGLATLTQPCQIVREPPAVQVHVQAHRLTGREPRRPRWQGFKFRREPDHGLAECEIVRVRHARDKPSLVDARQVFGNGVVIRSMLVSLG